MVLPLAGMRWGSTTIHPADGAPRFAKARADGNTQAALLQAVLKQEGAAEVGGW